MKRRFAKLLVVFLVLIMLTTILTSTTYAWSSITHQNAFFKGLYMLMNYYPEYHNNSVVQDMLRYSDFILDAADDPDNMGTDVTRELFNTGQFWSSHYMNPYTGLTYDFKWYAPNFQTDVSAGYMAKRYVDLAAGEWKKGNKAFATYLLAYASHFISDAMNPHHASLDISTEDALPIDIVPEATTHGEHEDWVNTHYDYLFNTYNLGVYNVGYTTGTPVEDRNAFDTILSQSLNKSLSDFVFERMLHYGKQVYGKGDDVVQLDLDIVNIPPEEMALIKGQTYVDWAYLGAHVEGFPPVVRYKYVKEAELNDWIDSGVAGLDASTELFAEVLYRFIYEVEHSETYKIVIETDKERYSGSDDAFFFRFSNAQGQYDEIYLDCLYLDHRGDLKDYDILDKGDRDTFYITMADPDFVNSINSFSLRHENVFFNDGWKPRTIKIYRNDILVHEQAINQWFENQNMRTFPLPNGLNYPTESPIGDVEISVLTKDISSGDTDDEVYLGFRTNTGLVHEIWLGNHLTSDYINGGIRNIENPELSWDNIQSMYFRKVNNDFWLGEIDPENAWCVDGLEIRVDVDGDGDREVIYAKDFDGRWISGSDNAIYEWNVNIDTSKEYFGIMEAEIGTLDVDGAGMDGDLYLDVELINGTTVSCYLGDDFDRNKTHTIYKTLAAEKSDVRKLTLRWAEDGDIGIKSFMFKHYGMYIPEGYIYPREFIYDFLSVRNQTHDFLLESAATGEGLGTFTINVKTGDEADAGTQDDVFIGFEFNGRDTLMLPLAVTTQDLSAGQMLKKTFTIANPNFKWDEVTKVFFRKRQSGSTDDRWKLDAFTISQQTKNIFGYRFNRWFDGSLANFNGEDFSILPIANGGINVDMNILGFYKVYLTVGNTSELSGTDSDLQLELKKADGYSYITYLSNPGGFSRGQSKVFDVFSYEPVESPFVKCYLRNTSTTDKIFEIEYLRVQFENDSLTDMEMYLKEFITSTNTYALIDTTRPYNPPYFNSIDFCVLTDSVVNSASVDPVYVGFEFSNGDRIEKLLPGGFATYEFKSFELQLGGKYRWDELSKVYFVKHGGTDALRIKACTAGFYGDVSWASSDTKWINANDTIFEMSRNWFSTTVSAIGFVKVDVKTKSGSGNGTNDPVDIGFYIQGQGTVYERLDKKDNEFGAGDTDTFYVMLPYNRTSNIPQVGFRKGVGGDDWYLESFNLTKTPHRNSTPNVSYYANYKYTASGSESKFWVLPFGF